METLHTSGLNPESNKNEEKPQNVIKLATGMPFYFNIFIPSQIITFFF